MGDTSNKGRKVLVVCATVLLLGIAFVYFASSAQSSALQEKIANAKLVDFPFEGKDIVPEFDYPASENAAPEYEAAFRMLQDLEPPKGDEQLQVFTLVSDRSATGKQLKVVEEFVEDYGPIFKVFEPATRKPYCYFEKDWDKGAFVLFPEFAQVKQVCKALSVSAVLRARKHDWSGAFADIETIQRAADHSAQSPTLIGLLVSIALHSIANNSMLEVVALADADTDVLGRAHEANEAMTESWDLTAVLRTEAFFGWWVSEQLANSKDFWGQFGVEPEEPLSFKLTKNSPFVKRTVQAKVLEVMVPALKDYRPGVNERKVFDELDERAQTAAATAGLARPFVDLIYPVFARVPDSLERQRAKKVSTRAVLDVLAYRAKHRTWPESLDGLGEYIDPFDGKPIRYRQEGEGFLVWSVGIDRIDNDGTERSQDSEGEDLVIAWPLKG